MRKVYTLLMGVVLAAMLAIPALADTARGRIKHVDADKSTITVTVRANRQAPGQDTDFTVTGDTKYLNANGDALADGLKSADLKEGAFVTLTTDTKDGKTVVTEVKLRAPRAPRNGGGAAPATPAK
jgi:Cu/Ag efflux protein CusF